MHRNVQQNMILIMIKVLLMPYFVRHRFACRTLKNSKISFSLRGAVRTFRMTWRNRSGTEAPEVPFFS